MAEPDASGKFSASVCLTEDDIPGVKLPKGSPEECNCWMLRRWLQCRGGRTTGKKAALVQRVKDYMKINCKLIDPDGGVNLAKKKARLGLCENISPKSPDEFPREGYNDDLSDVPVVDYNIIWKFMVQNVSGKGTSTAKPLIKGYNFFKSGHVVKLEKHLSEDGLCHLRGKILPSMKKSTSYTAFITLRDGKILRAKCGCLLASEATVIMFLLCCSS